jgi:hypothetical protein
MKKVSVTILSILFIFTSASSLCYAGNATLSTTTSVIAGEILYGCYKKENGQLRLVNNTDQCLPSEMSISWNQKGTAGPEGTEGPTGPQGSVGPPGAAGPPGPIGLQGAAGLPGPAGPTGPIGLQGPAGLPGSIGLQGPAGPPGSGGLQGQMGLPGPAGLQGPMGQKGSAGPTGMEVTYTKENIQTTGGLPYTTVDVFCDSGDMVISGGCDISDLNYPWVLQRTLPLLDVATAADPRNPRDGWSCTYNNVSGLRTPAVQIKAIVICADLTP